ncbi:MULTISPECIES: tRNA-dihydrouridine synthase [unclassified Colwellia]|uniref:tRNA-dihydrouridine synthase n=1 Tax=unclassified Colwellia TaxID=196834 RepID=UPI0015F4C2BA|nr:MULTISPECIES: tRNA-dihydrouridine synthase [unclassified Colwellia]MBA6357745.1 tRNA-dihydrouridine synthase [Colwellia sp. BRX8-3]MBA6361532.1 tRNA-dihydrouridine synthase [Colwellia sp. BRX8-6]MBA6369654.1 tRNA-dihydrouridine synthase [Colwellia sp. BRX8-5]MBA6377147.1 tRNA-dihydrouridine synthase [Colwellia sp. BRX8-2]
MNTQVKKVVLAPMEGVADALMRRLLTSLNNYDFCITEFLRIVDQLLPERCFYKVCPELEQQGYTQSGTPLRMQLLGQEPNWMAENAVRAIALGSHGVDLNFGCPAKTVNKNRGGAALLKTPEDIYKIVLAVKEAVGKDVILSAKIRLGFDDASLLDEIVSAITSAKADQLTIHARTKADGYRPPAYWHFIAGIVKRYPIEIFANGEIWNLADAHRCIEESHTSNLMLGRGALALPNLEAVIKNNQQPMPWHQLCSLLKQYSELELIGDKSFYFSSRLKQWLRYLRLQYPEAEQLFSDIKILKNKEEILTLLNKSSRSSL